MAECKDEDALASSFRSCANDPDFSVICAFLQKFSKDLGLDFPSFKQLQEWLTNTDEVPNPLRDLHIKLLRKTRKTVHEKSWEASVSKFCFTYSVQDAWEVERFGYKNSGLKVKLRILRELLESQFERNVKFRAKVLTANADSLRSQPIGRDRLGHAYWMTQDNDCNLRVYQEHLDEEIWQVVATNREEFVNLIARLRGNEVVLPSSDIGVIDEDSSSNSCTAPVEKPPPPEERDDSQEEEAKVPNLRIKLGSVSGGTSASTSTITSSNKTVEAVGDAASNGPSGDGQIEDESEGPKDGEDESKKREENKLEIEKKENTGGDCTDNKQKKVKPLLISHAKIAAAGNTNMNHNFKKRTLEEVDKSSSGQDEENEPKKPRPTLLDSKRAKKPSRYEKRQDEAYEEDEDDEEDDEEDVDDDDDEVDGDDVNDSEEDGDDDDDGGVNEDGDGDDGEEEDIDSAAAEEDENEAKEIEEYDGDEVSEVIEETTMVVRGEGSGAKCNSGNTKMPRFLEEQAFPYFNLETDEDIVGDEIEEQVFFVIGYGHGQVCFVGNPQKDENGASTTSSPSVEPKATFFFGQPGCLKLSPMKPTTQKDLLRADESSNQSENLDKSPTEKETQQSLIHDNQSDDHPTLDNDQSTALKNDSSELKSNVHVKANGDNGILEADKKKLEKMEFSTEKPLTIAVQENKETDKVKLSDESCVDKTATEGEKLPVPTLEALNDDTNCKSNQVALTAKVNNEGSERDIHDKDCKEKKQISPREQSDMDRTINAKPLDVKTANESKTSDGIKAVDDNEDIKSTDSKHIHIVAPEKAEIIVNVEEVKTIDDIEPIEVVAVDVPTPSTKECTFEDQPNVIESIKPIVELSTDDEKAHLNDDKHAEQDPKPRVNQPAGMEAAEVANISASCEQGLSPSNENIISDAKKGMEHELEMKHSNLDVSVIANVSAEEMAVKAVVAERKPIVVETTNSFEGQVQFCDQNVSSPPSEIASSAASPSPSSPTPPAVSPLSPPSPSSSPLITAPASPTSTTPLIQTKPIELPEPSQQSMNIIQSSSATNLSSEQETKSRTLPMPLASTTKTCPTLVAESPRGGSTVNDIDQLTTVPIQSDVIVSKPIENETPPNTPIKNIETISISGERSTVGTVSSAPIQSCGKETISKQKQVENAKSNAPPSVKAVFPAIVGESTAVTANAAAAAIAIGAPVILSAPSVSTVVSPPSKINLSLAMCPPISSIKTIVADTNAAMSLSSSSFAALNMTNHSNRKRRLADFVAPQHRQSTSESELDLARSEEIPAVSVPAPLEEELDDLGDVGGGKRLKMRPKFTNSELRKKVEAQKTAIEETTSSSGEEDSRRRRKIITPRKQVDKSLTANKSPKHEEMAAGVAVERKLAEAVSRKLPLDTATKVMEVPTPTKSIIMMSAAVHTTSTTTTPIVKPHKPTLAEIIEKKLKKTPEKSATASSDASSSSVENALLSFSPPKKSPITKPLKKNLLTQLRQEGSDEETIPRKRTISESTTTQQAHSEPLASKTEEQPLSSTGIVHKTERKTPERKTPERQRKRRSSEEVKPITDLQSASEKTYALQEGVSEKLKKNDDEMGGANALDQSSVKAEPKIVVLENDKTLLTSNEKTLAPKTSSEASPLPVVSRRSGRRGGAQVVYSELPQPKRTRGAGAAKTPAATPTAKKNEMKLPVMAKTSEETKKEKTATKPRQGNQKAEVKSATVKMPKKEIAQDNIKENDDQQPETPSITTKTVRGKAKEGECSVKTVKEEVINADANDTAEESLPANNVVEKTAIRGRGGGRRNREVDTSNIIEAADASETPVRQSRRIALQKIREEAERRKLEEIALRSMKQELKKKKKAEKQTDPTVAEPSEHSSSSDDDDEESEVEKKKRVRKKCPGKSGSWSSGSEELEEPEEEDEEPPHYDTDPGSPLFRSDHEFSPESELEDDSQQAVPMKRARTARKEDADDDGEDVRDEQACQKCGKSDHPEWILLCDNCDKGYHCSCLSPVLFYIPEGDWYCPPCEQDQLIVALEQQLKNFDDRVECKRVEAAETQRLLAEEAERAEQVRIEEEKERLERKARKKEERGSISDSSSSDDDEQLSELQRRRNGEKIKDEQLPHKSAKKARRSGGDEKKPRRGDGRSRRRAAARGDRRRRRHRVKSSGSESGGGNGGNGSESGSGSGSQSNSSSSSSSSATDSDDEPIYKLRKRRQINVSYRLNEFDDLINSALKKEMDEVAGAGNLGRGKDITTIIEADKEEKARQRNLDESSEVKPDIHGDATAGEIRANDDEKSTGPKADAGGDEDDDDDDDEPIKRKAKPLSKPTIKKKPRKLTTLDISSEEDNASDEDFKTSSFDDDEEEDTSVSVSSNSDSSLEIFRRRGKGGHKKQRKAARRAARERRKDRRFVVDESDEEEEEQTHSKSKKKRKDDSDYTETETSADGDDEELSELSENVDSADLCDDTTSEDSDGAWQPSKRKKQRKTQSGSVGVARKSPKLKKSQTKKAKRVEYSDDDISESEEEEDDDDDYAGGGSGKGASGKQPRSQPLKSSEGEKVSTAGVGAAGGGGAGSGKGKGKGKAPTSKKKKKKSLDEEQEVSCSDSGDSTRRTRGRRYAYLEDFDDDSSDGGIKPGVKRPDTPPEERQKFIERQEEIKRMLAAKNAEGAKLAATPRLTPIKGQAQMLDKDKRSPAKPGDSLSTVPLSVIRQAKVLDIDYLQRKGEQVGDIENVGDVESEFDDADLPDDLPEDMDEDDIARMVDEEEFGATATAAAARELPAADETIRNVSTTATAVPTASIATVTVLAPAAAAKVPKTKEPVAIIVPPTTVVVSEKPPATLTTNPSLAALSAMPTPSGLQEPLRKRLPMPTLHPPLLRHHFAPAHLDMPQAHLLQRHTSGVVPPPTHLLQNALSAPLGQPLNRSFQAPPAQLLAPRMPGLASVVASAAHLLPPHLIPSAAQTLASTQPPPLQDTSSDDGKPRGRRKKITPLRDALQKQQTAAAASANTIITSGSEKTQTTTTVPASAPVSVTTTTALSTGGVIKSALPATTSTAITGVHPPHTLYKLSATPSGDAPSPSPQPSVITRMPHLPPGRPGGPPTSIYGSNPDVVRFYGPTSAPQSLTGSRPPPPQAHSQPPRHRLPLQLGGLPPSHHGMRPTYGPPPPLRGAPSPNHTSLLPPNSSASTVRGGVYVPSTQASDLHTTQQLNAVYGGVPPPARSAAPHLNPYRPHIYGNPNYAPPPRGMPTTTGTLRTGPPTPHAADYVGGARVYPPYGYYPPPPPLTAHQSVAPPPGAHPTLASAPSSVIVSAPPAAATLSTSASARVITKSPSPTAAALNSKSVIESRKKQLTTLDSYAVALNKSPLALGGESSGSRSSPGMQADATAEDSSSAPAASSAGNVTAVAGGSSEGQASEFSGLVSYFSSQHDDYNS